MPTVSITAPAATNEGNSGTTAFVFTVGLSAASPNTVTVDYSTGDLTAAAPSDYTAQSGTVTFTPGQTTKLIAIAVNGDTTIEADELFVVGLSNPTNATITGSGIAVGTIMNDDSPPTVTITSPAATNEGNSGTTNFVFTVTLSAISASTVTVDYATADGSASSLSDYTATSGTVTFAAGQTTKQIVVAVNGDTTVETNETFTVNLSNPTNATIAGTGIGTGTITNDDTLPTLTLAAPAATNEGNSGTTNFVFTATLSAASVNTVTVDYTTVDGSATAPSDYTAQNGTLSFAPGQISQPITVAVKGDTTVEINETFTVNLSNPTNATIAGASATATITNDDTLPTATITAPAATNEGNSGTTNFVFTATLSAASVNTVTVDYTTVDGSATAPSDYTAQSGTVSFSPGQTTKQVVIAVNGDTAVETNETFAVNLSNPVNATIAGTGIGTATINNDDNLPGLTITAPAATNEGNSGTTAFVFNVALSAASSGTVTVDYTTLDVTATAPSDYTAQSGTVTFTPGQTTKLIAIAVNGDTTNETNETFSVTLSNPANATITTSAATATITNDDSPPTVTITSPAATNEGNSGTTNFVFTVTLSAISASTVTVDYATADGSASSLSDYTATSGTVTFAAGQTTKQIVVAVNGDTTVETNETFTVNLSNPTNATIAGTGIGTGTITNDDTLPTLTLAAPAATNEGNSGTTNFVFTATLSAASVNTVTVDYTTVDGSATAPSDYTAQNGTLSFAPGQISQPITVAVKGDTTVEINETFTVNLSNPTNATIAGASATATITNDDTLPTATITAPAATNEGNSGTTVNAVFTVTLSAISANTVTVDYTTVDGSATAGSGDYVAQTGTLTYAPGQTNQQIVVVVKGDTLNEINETFTVNLANPSNATIAGTGIGTATINNDDAVPTLSINNVSQAEGSGGGTTAFTFTVTLSTASGLPITVDFTTADGSATAPSDYAAQSGTLTFSPGQTTKTITIAVVADAVNEANETFTVTLSNPANATIASATGTGTIQNDD